ncbi:transglycosylase SLT domain-containing protein [Chelativorans sp. ZYF759]|nr:transglycosylase SLT domain-containing protein [Chelativorans sp. ZYF759]NMG41485.1 transglycosylase SLT domain-containing protein [Chelativorans sp. ZYF759]
MHKMTVLAAALAAGISSLTLTSNAGAAEDQITNLEAYQQTGMGRFMLGLYGEPQEADTQSAALVEEGKAEALQGATTQRQQPYAEIISRHAQRLGVPEGLAHAVIQVESNYRASARGQAGEIGLMQIKPATARGIGFSGNTQALFDPETNIRYGMKYLAQARQLAGGDLCGTILRYNAGHGATRMNRISSNYCNRVQRIMAGA